MKLYLFLALQGKPFVLPWPSLDMPRLFPPPSLSTGCVTCLKCLLLFCLSFKAQLQAYLSRKALCLFQPTETSFSIHSSSCNVCPRNTTFSPMACAIPPSFYIEGSAFTTRQEPVVPRSLLPHQPTVVSREQIQI